MFPAVIVGIVTSYWTVVFVHVLAVVVGFGATGYELALRGLVQALAARRA